MQNIASSQHSFTNEQSLGFWKQRWKAQIDAQPPRTRAETIARAALLLRTTRHHSALHDLAVCYGLTKGGDGGECMDK